MIYLDQVQQRQRSCGSGTKSSEFWRRSPATAHWSTLIDRARRQYPALMDRVYLEVKSSSVPASRSSQIDVVIDPDKD